MPNGKWRQMDCASTLVALSPDSELGFKTLTRLLNDADAEIVESAAHYCGWAGKNAKPLLPLLEKLYEEKKILKWGGKAIEKIKSLQ